MSDPEPSIVAKAFSKTFTKPRSFGRREPDQIKWWIHAIKTLGFPIVVAWFVLARLEPALDRLQAATERNTRAIIAQTCRMDPQACAAIIAPHTHNETVGEP